MKNSLKLIALLLVFVFSGGAWRANDAKKMTPQEVRQYVEKLKPDEYSCRVGYTNEVAERNLSLYTYSKISLEEYSKNQMGIMKHQQTCKKKGFR